MRVRGDISYRFSVEHVSEELVVRGEMALAADIQCSRCSEFFSTSIGVSDFLREENRKPLSMSRKIQNILNTVYPPPTPSHHEPPTLPIHVRLKNDTKYHPVPSQIVPSPIPK